MGHAEDDVLDAQLPAALDDLLKGRNHAFAAIKAEALGAGVFHVEKILEALALDELAQDGFLAFRGEGNFLVGPFNTLLQPALLHGIGDVHEFHTQGVAVGAFQDIGDLADGGLFEAQHLVEENRAVKVGPAEAIGGGLEFRLGRALGQAQRIEIGGEVATHAEGADHHQGAHRIHGGLAHFINGKPGACCFALGLNLAANGFFHRRPIAIKGGDEIARRRQRPIFTSPGRTGNLLPGGGRVIVQAGKKLPPVGIHGGGVFQIFGIEPLNELGIAAIEEGRLFKSRSQVCLVHRHHFRSPVTLSGPRDILPKVFFVLLPFQFLH